jgi:hypothetical protein
MAGIENSKKFLLELASAAEGIQAVLEDGKVTLLDVRHAPKLFGDVKSAVDAIKGMESELKDLSKEEVQELMALVIELGLKLAEKFDLKV